MSIIVKRRQFVERYEFALGYEWRDCPGAGFSFPCDEDGNVLPLEHEAARENFRKCKDGSFDVVEQGIVRYDCSYWEPAEGKCSCGRLISLDHFTNTCSCGRDYDSSGWLLAPRECWGEETGEYPSDILRIP